MVYFNIMTLSCFLAVAETGSVTRAAKRIARTQSAISQQISKLEMQLGKTLFIRGTSLSLTSEGEIFLPYAQKILKLNREAIDRFKEPELHGDVRFGLPEDFASVFLSDVLVEYTALHPRISLNVECDLTLHLFHKFKEKELDLVLLKMSKPEDFPNGVNVWSEPLEWVGNHEFFKTSDEPIPLVLSPQPCVYRTRAIHALEKINKKWRVVFSSHSYAGTLAAVKANMGITVLARNMVPKDLPIIRPNQEIPILDNTHISLLKHDNNNQAINFFEQFVIATLQLNPYLLK